MSTLLLSAWSVTTTAFDKHKQRNSRAYTDTPVCRAEALALLNFQPAAINVASGLPMYAFQEAYFDPVKGDWVNVKKPSSSRKVTSKK